MYRLYTLEQIRELRGSDCHLSAREDFLLRLVKELADEIIKLKNERIQHEQV